MRNAIEFLKQAHNVYDNKVKFLTKYADRVDKLAKDFNEAGVFITGAYITEHSLEINVSGDRATLGKCFRLLRKNGLVPNDRPTKGTTNYATYFYDRGADTEQAGVFMVWFDYASTQCKRVIKGYKTEQVPIYEIVCSDDNGVQPELQDLSGVTVLNGALS